MTCYLEVDAIRRLIGSERAAGVINRKPHYLWIYQTVLRDERVIAGVVSSHGLGIQ